MAEQAESVSTALILSPEFARKVAVSLSVAGRNWTESDVQLAILVALTDCRCADEALGEGP